MITDILALLDWEAWKAADPRPHPDGAENTAEFRADMQAAFSDRQARVQTVIAQIASIEVSETATAVVSEGVADLTQRMADNASQVESVMNGEAHSSEIWFHCADQPDRDVAAVMYRTGEKLKALPA